MPTNPESGRRGSTKHWLHGAIAPGPVTPLALALVMDLPDVASASTTEVQELSSLHEVTGLSLLIPVCLHRVRQLSGPDGAGIAHLFPPATPVRAGYWAGHIGSDLLHWRLGHRVARDIFHL